MTFYKKLLEEYMQTKEGRKVTHIFENFSLYVREKKRSLFKFLIDSGITQYNLEFYLGSESEMWKIVKSGVPHKRGFDPRNDAEKNLLSNLKEIQKEKQDEIRRNNLKEIVLKVPAFSLKWFICDNECAFPYLFFLNHKALNQICQYFTIPLPDYSARSTDVEKRLNHYFEICDTLKEFRENNEMSPVELCVFIYGYAMQTIRTVFKPCDISSELTASKAFYTSSLGDNLNIKNNVLFPWCALQAMKKGDIIFMYESAPKQCIRYIVQVCTDAFDDPFGWWGRSTVHVVLLAKCPRISLKEIKKDPVLNNIASKLRGPSGYAFSQKEYDAILRILEEKQFPVSELPQVTWTD